MNTTATRPNDIVLAVLSHTHGGFGYGENTDSHRSIMAILNDDSKLVEGQYGDDATLAAEEVRAYLWSRYSGGGASAGATCTLFYALGRQDELGWVAGEAAYPDPYGEREFGWFMEDMTPEVKGLIAQHNA